MQERGHTRGSIDETGDPTPYSLHAPVGHPA